VTFVIAIVIVAAGAALQAATGMGMALFAAPLLALVDPAFVPGPTLCAFIALSAAVAWRECGAIDRRILLVALLGLSAGCAIGAVLLQLLIGRDFGLVFAILIVAAVFLSVAGLHIRTSKPALLIGGAASGILGTMAGCRGRRSHSCCSMKPRTACERRFALFLLPAACCRYWRSPSSGHSASARSDLDWS
jgi:uncharacterized membrane protein YfcA